MSLLDTFFLLLLSFYPTVWMTRTLLTNERKLSLIGRFIVTSVVMLILSGRAENYLHKNLINNYSIGSLQYYCMAGFVEEFTKTAGAVFLLRGLRSQENLFSQIQYFLGVGYFFGLFEGILRIVGVASTSKAFILSQSIPFGIDIHISLIIQDAFAVYITSYKRRMWKYAILIIIVTSLEHAGFDYFYSTDPLKLDGTFAYYAPVLLIFVVSCYIFYVYDIKPSFLSASIGSFISIFCIWISFFYKDYISLKQNIYIPVVFSIVASVSEFFLLKNRKIDFYHKNTNISNDKKIVLSNGEDM